jgi:hypothetical protein
MILRVFRFFIAFVFSLAMIQMPRSAVLARDDIMTFDEMIISGGSNVSLTHYNDFYSEAIKSSTIERDGIAINPCLAPVGVASPHATRVSIRDGYSITILRRTRWHGMERVDDLLAKRSWIYRPSEKDILYIDERRRIYDSLPYLTLPYGRVDYIGEGNASARLTYEQARHDLGKETVDGIPVHRFEVSSALGEIVGSQKTGTSRRALIEQRSVLLVAGAVVKPGLCENQSLPDMDNFFRPIPARLGTIELQDQGPRIPLGLRVYHSCTATIVSNGRANTSSRTIMRKVVAEPRDPASAFAAPADFKKSRKALAVAE